MKKVTLSAIPLTQDNWQQAAIEAIRTLPADIRPAVSYERESEDILEICVADDLAHPRLHDRFHSSPFEVRYWGKLFYLCVEEDHELGLCNPKPHEFELLSNTNWTEDAQRRSEPLVTICLYTIGDERNRYFLADQTTVSFQRHIQLGVLELLEFSAYHYLVKDSKDRYLRRTDRSPVLSWQFNDSLR